MKIAVFGLSLSSSWGNGHATTYRSLLTALSRRGHEITFFERDQPWYAENRDLASPAFCKLRLYRSLAELGSLTPAIAQQEAVILGSYVPQGVEIATLLLSTGVRPLFFYDIDTPVTLAALEEGTCRYLTRELIVEFDAYLSFSGGKALEAIGRRYGARLPLALYCSADAGVYRPLDLPVRWDMGYLGTFSSDRQAALERLLIEPAKRLPDKRFVVAGAQYPDSIRWPENVERLVHVPPEEHARFYSSLGFALNVTRSDMVALGHSPSVRLFEASACATPVISDPWPGLGDFFAIGHEVMTAETTEDVLKILSSTDDARRAAVGRAGYLRFLREHQAMHRARQLEKLLLGSLRCGIESSRRVTA